MIKDCPKCRLMYGGTIPEICPDCKVPLVDNNDKPKRYWINGKWVSAKALEKQRIKAEGK